MHDFRRKTFTGNGLIPLRQLLWLGIAWLLFAAGQTNADSIVKDGIKVDFKLESVAEGAASQNMIEGTDAVFNFQITDQSGAALSGAYPAAWMQRRAESIATDDRSCKNMVKSFIGGSILAQPTLNLNTYYVVVLNNDASLSVVDPLFQFGGTNLLTMLPLSSPGFDWQMAQKQQRLFVSLPKSKRLAVIDTVNFTKMTELEVAGEPGVVALQPDQHYLWVAFEDKQGNKGGVELYNTLTNEKVTQFELGTGSHHMAFTGDSQFAFVTAEDNNNVTVIDIATLQVVKTIATAKQPIDIDWSPAADAIYVTHRGDGKVVSINARNFTISKHIALDKGIEDLSFAPNGRHALVVNPVNDAVYVIDSLNDRVSKKGKVESGPDQINFSDTLAYIRHRSSETVLMIPMDSIVMDDVELQVVDFPGGEKGFGLATTPAAGIIQAPGQNAVLVAHPKDQQIYYYREGMAAPMGSFKNFGRDARAVLAVDRSLQEHDGGVYKTAGRLGEAGTYDVAFFMDSPRIIHCFAVRVMPKVKRDETQQLQISAVVLPGQKFTSGEASTLMFRLQDSHTGAPLAGLNGLNSLSVLAPGMWKTRGAVKAHGEGVYSIDWQPPKSGAYFIQLFGDWKALNMLPPRQIMLRVM